MSDSLRFGVAGLADVGRCLADGMEVRIRDRAFPGTELIKHALVAARQLIMNWRRAPTFKCLKEPVGRA